jgi:hypothetical protein
MGFSVFVEMLNLRIRAKDVKPVKLRQAYAKENKKKNHKTKTVAAE